MPREAEPSNLEKEFILEALHENLRIDGRGFDQFRNVDLTFGDDYGSVTVQLGRTRINVQLSAEVVKPLDDRPFDGIFTIVTELSPIASPAFEVGRPTEQEIILSRILEKAIRRSNAIDTESLCIVSGSKCWSIRADVHILDHDGGLVDGSCIALIAALQHFRRPDVSVDGEDVTIYTLAERVPVPLSIMHQPLCVSFNFYHEGETILVDATLREEQVREGDMVITMNRYGEVCQIAKMGGVPVDPILLLNCTKVALEKVKDITKLISTRLDEDTKQRNIGGLITELRAENNR
ncbi:putative exosome complex endonuclease 2 ribosomal rna processing protein [Phaeomoniella chlamydospora]|uniref:Exosome complex component RRP45 n=1 Tax=Phaeomoniella chlamydospora TaxID=158046 RepID=A0A0G2FTF6_PHACM|nr:putative exosome complex endonuclease 2 ribosomal rna processing protein [Phaeomoniella chlamydospora]